jgi:hypothetical protein
VFLWPWGAGRFGFRKRWGGMTGWKHFVVILLCNLGTGKRALVAAIELQLDHVIQEPIVGYVD